MTRKQVLTEAERIKRKKKASRKFSKSLKGRKNQRRYFQSPKGKRLTRKKNLKRSYGITLEKYDNMFALQHGVCAICGSPQLSRRLSVDHNHKTGKMRGLLCKRCNLLLGHIENPSVLIPKIKEYLERWKGGTDDTQKAIQSNSRNY